MIRWRMMQSYRPAYKQYRAGGQASTTEGVAVASMLIVLACSDMKMGAFSVIVVLGGSRFVKCGGET